MTNYVYIATTIDGFIARKNGSIDWLESIPNPSGDDFGFNDFLNKIDAIIMGKNTFEKVLTFGEWPYSKPVFVVSNSLKTLPTELKEKAGLVNGEPEDIIKELNKKGLNNFYIDGGVTIQNFLKKNLIDEMIITRVPILLGSGIPLFESSEEIKFEHIKTDILNNYLVKSHYRKLQHP